jgi:hypothetical protein
MENIKYREEKQKKRNKFWDGSVLDTYIHFCELPRVLHCAFNNLIDVYNSKVPIYKKTVVGD